MAQIEGEIVIARPVEEVFDFVADERNEPSFNRQMSAAELLTPEPIGSGSRFHAEMKMMRRTVDMTVEFTQFDRPRLLALTSRSLTRGGRGRPMVIGGSLTFDPVAEGTRMRWVAGGDARRDEAVHAARGLDGSAAGAAGLEQLEAAPRGAGSQRPRVAARLL